MIHKFYQNGYYIVLDVNSGGVHVVDELTYRLLDYVSEPVSYTHLDVYKRQVTDRSVDVDLKQRPAQKVSVISDEHGKFLIIESENVETKIKLPF